MLEVFTFIVAVILLVLPIVDWTATGILFRAYRKAAHSNIALKERTQMAMVLAFSSTLNASLAVVRLGSFQISPPIPVIILSISLILSSIPNIYWMSLYFTNRIRR